MKRFLTISVLLQAVTGLMTLVLVSIFAAFAVRALQPAVPEGADAGRVQHRRRPQYQRVQAQPKLAAKSEQA